MSYETVQIAQWLFFWGVVPFAVATALIQKHFESTFGEPQIVPATAA